MEIEKEAQHLKAAKARSTCEVFIVMKMLETQVGQLAGRPMGNKEEFRDKFKVPRRRRLLKLVRERRRITLRRP
jgi:hypothetical protein